MKAKPLFIIQGALFAATGVMFLAVPVLAMDMFVGDMGVTPSFYVLTRMVGGTAVALAVILFGLAGIQEIRVKRVVAGAMVVGTLASAVLHAYGIMVNSIMAAGWIMVGIEGILALLFLSTFLTKNP